MFATTTTTMGLLLPFSLSLSLFTMAAVSSSLSS